MSWLFLLFGVIAETLSHVALKETEGFTRPVPSALVLIGHLAAFMFLSQATGIYLVKKLFKLIFRQK